MCLVKALDPKHNVYSVTICQLWQKGLAKLGLNDYKDLASYMAQ